MILKRNVLLLLAGSALLFACSDRGHPYGVCPADRIGLDGACLAQGDGGSNKYPGYGDTVMRFDGQDPSELSKPTELLRDGGPYDQDREYNDLERRRPDFDQVDRPISDGPPIDRTHVEALDPDLQRDEPPAAGKDQPCGELSGGYARCGTGLICIVKSGAKAGTCKVSCDPSAPNCPKDHECLKLSVKSGFCVPKMPTAKLGQPCGKVGTSYLSCDKPYICAKMNYEKQNHCRAPCDPKKTGACPKDFLCGEFPDGSGACFPEPQGTVPEFGKCGSTQGSCVKGLICVVASPQHTYGFCLRACGTGGLCQKGSHCIKNLNACAEECDPSKSTCSYGQCRRLSSDPNNPVCF